MNRAPSARDPWWEDHRRSCGGTYTKIKEPENYGKKGKNEEKKGKNEERKDKNAAKKLTNNTAGESDYIITRLIYSIGLLLKELIRPLYVIHFSMFGYI